MRRILWERQLVLFVLLLILPALPGYATETGLHFVANKKQWPSPVLYKTDVQGGAVFFTTGGFRYGYYDQQALHDFHELKHKDQKNTKIYNNTINCFAYEVSFVGSNAAPVVSGSNKLPCHHNYFLGKDPSKWSSEVPVFNGITYDDLYDNIDLKVYSIGSSMKYDFLVAPGADASVITLRFDGVKPVLNTSGDLIIKTTVNTVTEQKPYAYQLIDGRQIAVPCNYTLGKNGSVGFSFPEDYDHTIPLVIDPVLVFGTYSGSTSPSFGWSATYDVAGHLYAGGESFMTGWPVTTGSFQSTFGGAVDCGINKYSPDGSTLIYSTYFGGTNMDFPNSMVVNDNGELIMAGITTSPDMPVTAGCFDNSSNGIVEDLYVVHFNASGSALIGSTYVGGSESEFMTSGEVLAEGNDIYVAAGSFSPDFPVTTGAIQQVMNGFSDGVLFKLDATCSALQWSTYLGGDEGDECIAIVRNNAGNIVVTGTTSSTNFPVTAGALNTSGFGVDDVFVAIIDPAGTSILHATYLGTTLFDQAAKVQVDPADNVYVCASTQGIYPVSPGVYSNPGGEVFVHKLSPSLSATLLSTTIGTAGGFLRPSAFLYDVCGNIYICAQGAGNTAVTYPLTPNAFQSTTGGFWFCVLGQNMSVLSYATYMGDPGDHNDGGSSRFDPLGIIYHSVCTNSFNSFPTTSNAFGTVNQSGSFDIASFKFALEAIGVSASIGSTSNDTVCVPASVQFTNNTVGGTDYIWDFGDGSPASNAVTPPPHLYSIPGTYTITLFAENNDINACGGKDTAYYTLKVLDGLEVVAEAGLAVDDTGCAPYDVQFTNNSINALSYIWDFGDGSSPDVTAAPSHRYNHGGTFTAKLYASNPGICNKQDTAMVAVHILNTAPDAQIEIVSADSGCTSYTLAVNNLSADATGYLWDFGDGTTDISFNPPPHTYHMPGAYNVILYAFNPQLCRTEDTDTVLINASLGQSPFAALDAGEDVAIRLGDQALLTVNGNGDGPYQWTPEVQGLEGDGSSVLVSPSQTTEYFISSLTPAGCILIDSVTVFVTNAIVPDAFTPNGDGRNDIFHLLANNGHMTLLNLSVYDRWGKRVFTTNNIAEGWDGTYADSPAELGVYFYSLDFVIGSRQYNQKGDLTLVR